MRTNDPRALARRGLSWARAARAASAVLFATALVACDRKPAPLPADTPRAAPPAAVPESPAAPSAPVSGWDTDAGTALLVPSEGGGALVIVPGEAGEASTDRTAGSANDVLPAEVSLFSRGGAAGHAKAVATDASAPNGCAWPTARLGPASGADVLPAWTVGFVGGTPAPIALDSIEGLSSADSALLAATVTRLASSLGDDTVRAFRGVPFTVRTARRFAIGGDAGAREGLVAVLTRALNQEAAPLSEQLLLVAERPRGDASAPWTVAYHERQSGREDDVTVTDVLGAVALGPAQRPTLVLARAMADGSRYALLERTGDLAWRVRWTSAVRRC